MKLGDLVKIKNDINAVCGIGLITEDRGRTVRVKWNDTDYFDDDLIEIVWKANLEVISEGHENS